MLRTISAIFKQFTQSSQTKTGAGGTGLGLAICRKIIGDHSGRAWAENNKPSGSKNCFSLPKDIEIAQKM